MEGAIIGCRACGAPAAPEARFCAACGARLTSAAGSRSRRTLTALFVDIAGSTTLGERLDPEDFTALVGDALARMAEVVGRFGATVEHTAGDGLLALFGAPVAHEDDAERAVLAGLGLVRDLRAYAQDAAPRLGLEPFAVRVGIETGPVVVGTVGDGRALEYTAMGDAVNTAKRLQEAARADAVLVGARTRQLVEGLFVWGETQRLHLKGKATAVTACEVRARARAAAPIAQPALVGREVELEAATALVRRLRGGTGGVLVLTGEAGIGKSRLLDELRDRFAEPDRWLEARCASYEQGVPHRPLEALLGPRLEPVLAAAAREDLAAPERRTRAGDALAEVLRELAAAGPFVVAVDDAHWIDPSSAALLRVALPVAAEMALLVILAARPERDGRAAGLLAAARDTGGARAVELAPLDPEAGRRLVGALAGTALPADLERRVLERGAGNPLYLRELVRELHSAGDLPETIERVILARLDRLAAPERDALAAAAVLGRRFDAALLAAVSDAGTAVPSALRALEEHGLLRPEDGAYGFEHTLIQETAYGGLLRARRRELHGRAARALAAQAPAEHALLARHFTAAGDDERAQSEHAAAAQNAMAVGAVEEAIAHDDAALAAAARLGRSADEAAVRELLQRRGWARTLSGDLRGGAADAERVLAAARAAGDRRGQLTALQAFGLLRHVHLEQLVDTQREALALAREFGDAEAEVLILARLAIFHVARLHLDLARDDAERAEGRARETGGGERLLARALDAGKLVALQFGDLARLEGLCTQLEAIHARLDDRFMHAWTALEAAFVPLAQARFADAEAGLRRAIELNAASASRYTYPLFLDAVGWLERSRGELGAALEAGREAHRLARTVGIRDFVALTAATLGWTLLDADRVADAAAVLDGGLAAAAEVGATAQVLRCAGLLAEARLRGADDAGARDAADQGEAALGSGSLPAGEAFLYGAQALLALARVRLAAGDADRAETLVAPVLAAAERSGWLEAGADAATALARVRLAAGDADAARSLAGRAARAAREAGLPRAERDAARTLVAAGDPSASARARELDGRLARSAAAATSAPSAASAP